MFAIKLLVPTLTIRWECDKYRLSFCLERKSSPFSLDFYFLFLLLGQSCEMKQFNQREIANKSPSFLFSCVINCSGWRGSSFTLVPEIPERECLNIFITCVKRWRTRSTGLHEATRKKPWLQSPQIFEHTSTYSHWTEKRRPILTMNDDGVFPYLRQYAAKNALIYSCL